MIDSNRACFADKDLTRGHDRFALRQLKVLHAKFGSVDDLPKNPSAGPSDDEGVSPRRQLSQTGVFENPTLRPSEVKVRPLEVSQIIGFLA
jgi:hypothetical protein